MQHDAVGDPAGELERLAADRHHQHRDVLVEGAVLVEVRVGAGRSVVAHHGLAVPQRAVDPDRVLDLRAGDPRHAHDVEEQVEAAAEAERVAAAGQPVHRRRDRRGDQRVPGVVVGRGRRDADGLADRARRAGHHGGVLDVEPLGEEDRADAQSLGEAHLVEQVTRAGGVPGEAVAADLGELLAAGRDVVSVTGGHASTRIDTRQVIRAAVSPAAAPIMGRSSFCSPTYLRCTQVASAVRSRLTTM